MSLSLDQGTVPHNLQVKTFGHMIDGNTVHIGTYEISLSDFLQTAVYVLTNTDLAASDERRDFVALVSQMQEVPGWAAPATKLAIP